MKHLTSRLLFVLVTVLSVTCAASLAFDGDRDEVRLNPAIESILGPEEAKKWRLTADELLSRSFLRTAEVMDAFGSPYPTNAIKRRRKYAKLTGSTKTSTDFADEIEDLTEEYHDLEESCLTLAAQIAVDAYRRRGVTLPPIALLILYPHFTRSETQKSEKKERRALDLLRDPPLRRVIIMSGLMVASYELFAFYIPIHTHAAGLSASAIGLILATYAAATFVTRFFLPFVMRRMQANEVMFWFMLLSACGFLVLPFLRTQYPLMLVAFVIGIGSGVGQPLSMTLSYNRSPAGRTGEVTGLRLTVNNISRIVIPLGSGTLGAAFGAAPVFWMNAVNLATISWLARR